MATPLTARQIESAKGGDVSISTLGTSHIFTLRGGKNIIYSNNGDTAATGVLEVRCQRPADPRALRARKRDVKTNLAGLANGDGGDVLTTVESNPLGDVDLIVASGAIDAGVLGYGSHARQSSEESDRIILANAADPGDTRGPCSSGNRPAREMPSS